MRIAPSAFIFCCLMLFTSTVVAPPSAVPATPAAPTPAAPTPKSNPAAQTPKSSRTPLNDNPQIQRNAVDTTIAWTPAVKESQDQLRRVLVKALQATPKPTTPYELSNDEVVADDIGAKTGMVKGTQRWVPISARADREYQVVGDETEESDEVHSRIFEVQVALNGTLGLTTGLATKSDKPHIVELQGAVAVEQTAIPTVDSTKVDSGDPDHAPEDPMTLLRIYVVDPDLETHVRKLQKETGAFPGFGPTQVLADHPDELRSIVISYYGPKKDVDAIARKIDMAALRRLLAG